MMSSTRLWVLLLAVGACVLGVSAGKPKYKPQCPLPGMAPSMRSGCILCNRTRVCTDFDTDPRNCGSCFTSCALNQVCRAGKCVTLSTCIAEGGQCSSIANCCGQFVSCCDGTCLNTMTNPYACGPSCAVCPTGVQCTFGRCPSGSQAVNRDIRGLSTCAIDGITPIDQVAICNATQPVPQQSIVATIGLNLNIARLDFESLGVPVGGCMTVSMCELNTNAAVSGNAVDLSWAAPVGANSSLPTCANSNCNSGGSSSLLSRINIQNTGQQNEVVSIISRNGVCLANLAVRLTRAMDCSTFTPLPTPGGGAPLPVIPP